MEAKDIAGIIVTIVALLSAYAAQRAAAKASVSNTTTTSRVDMEREAYERARAFDIETIARQDKDLIDLRARVRELEMEVKHLKDNPPHVHQGV